MLSVVSALLFSVSCYAAYGTVVDGSAVVPLESFKELGIDGYYNTNEAEKVCYVTVYRNDKYEYGAHFDNIEKKSSCLQTVYALDSDGKADSTVASIRYDNVPVSYINGKAYVSARSIYKVLTSTISDFANSLSMSWDAENKIVHYSFGDKDLYIPCVDISILTEGSDDSTYFIDTSSNDTTVSYLNIVNSSEAGYALPSSIITSTNNSLGIDNERFTAIKNIFESYVDRISKCTTNDEAIAIANEISNRTSDYEYYISNSLSSNEKIFAQNAMLISNYIALCKSADIIVEKASKLTNKTIEGEKSFDIAVKMGRLIFDTSDMNFVKQVEYELRSSLTSMVSGFQSALQ